MIPSGQVYNILAAIDVSLEPSEQKANDEAKGGRIIEVEDDESNDSEDASSGYRKESSRCLKLGLQCTVTGSMVIGIELERINWNRPTGELVGKRVKLYVHIAL